MSKPLMFRNDHKPINNESKDISSKYNKHNSSEKPHIVFGLFLTSEKSSNIYEHTRGNIESKCLGFWKSIRTNRHIKKGNKGKNDTHKNPRRKNRIGYVNISNHPITNLRSFWCRYMWTSCNLCCRCFRKCIHKLKIERSI